MSNEVPETDEESLDNAAATPTAAIDDTLESTTQAALGEGNDLPSEESLDKTSEILGQAEEADTLLPNLYEQKNAQGSQVSNGKKFYGKYRGTVVDNTDPEQRGRIRAMVPAISDESASWAMPCLPMAGKEQGFFMVPQVGAKVWMEFEGGDPDKPIWVGGFWETDAEIPKLALEPSPASPGQNVVLETTLHNMLLLSDAAPSADTGGIIIKSATGAMIVVNDSGIYIDNGSGATISMIGSKVEVNKGALEVV